MIFLIRHISSQLVGYPSGKSNRHSAPLRALAWSNFSFGQNQIQGRQRGLTRERAMGVQMHLATERIRTLVVDDSPLALKRICSCLDSKPALQVVGTAADGKEALRQAEKLHPELVLLDLQMPGFNGLEVASRLSGNPHAPAVVIITGLDVSGLTDRLGDFGVSGLVRKQYLNEELPQLLDRILPTLHH